MALSSETLPKAPVRVNHTDAPGQTGMQHFILRQQGNARRYFRVEKPSTPSVVSQMSRKFSLLERDFGVTILRVTEAAISR